MHDIVQSNPQNIAEIMRDLMELRGKDRETAALVVHTFASMLEALPYSFHQQIEAPRFDFSTRMTAIKTPIWNPRDSKLILVGTVSDHRRFKRFFEYAQETTELNCGLYIQCADSKFGPDFFEGQFELITYPITSAGDITVKLMTPLYAVIHEVYERLRELASRPWNLTDPMEKALLHYTEALVVFYDNVLNHGYEGFSQQQEGQTAQIELDSNRLGYWR